MTARKLDSFLSEASSPLSRLNAAAQRLGTLAHVWEAIAPIGLARYCRVGRLDDSVLTLFADNGAIASKVLQQLPSLLSKFQQRGCEITGIRVDVQVNLPLSKPAVAPKSAISDQGLASLKKLETDLPESELKVALTNLIRNQIESGQHQSTDGESQADDQQQHHGKLE
jgi:hypothetical protein